MKSLLNKTITQFIGCTVIIMLLATPVFYLLTKHFYAEELMDIIEVTKKGNGIPHIDLEEDILQGLMIQFFLIFTVLSCSMFITLRIITRKLWLPFDDTLQKMERFNLEQNTAPKFKGSNIKEFDRLNSSISLLIKRNRQSYRTQKEFTENASHELQTPLAIAQSKLDILLQEDLSEPQFNIVNDLYQTFTRMSRLNKNLLMLARIENSQYEDISNIDLCDYVEKQVPKFESLLSDSTKIILELQNPIFINANEVLLESLLNNLVVNAIRHSSNDSNITIRISETSLSVYNNTHEGALDKNMLFKRFVYTNSPTRGNGLGLSIVKAICDFHKWNIDYTYINSRHCFTVTFKTDI